MHAAILDTNAKQSDLFTRRLIRLMYMVESEDIDFPNLNSHLMTYDDINRQSSGDTLQITATSPGNDRRVNS